MNATVESGQRRWVGALTVAGSGIVTVAGITAGVGPVIAAVAGAVVAVGAGLRWRRPAIGPALVAVALCAAPFVWSAFNLAQVLVLAVGALGLVLLSGQTGQISVAQGPFVGVGAYTTAVLSQLHGVPALLTLPIAVVVGALAGLVVGIPTARLRGVYQVITTLGVGVAFPSILIVIGDPVGGSTGIPVPNPLNVTVHFGNGQYLDPTRLVYVVCALGVLVTWAVLARIVRSRHGVAMRALRQNEIVAAVNGIHVGRYRVLAFVVSAGVAGLAGGLYAISVGAVSPDSFGILYSIQFLVAIAIGGSERLAGAVVGAVAVFLLTTQVHGIPVPGTTVIVSNVVLYGVAVILVLLFLKGGIWGGLVRAAAALARRRSPTPVTAPAGPATEGGAPREPSPSPAPSGALPSSREER